MHPPKLKWIALFLGFIAVAIWIPSKVSVWVDPDGELVLSNRADGAPSTARTLAPSEIALHWEGEYRGERVEPGSTTVDDDDRFTRELLAARDDMTRGETRRGLRRLRRLHREHPERPEVAYLLAEVERDRGRLEPAKDAIDAALSVAGGSSEVWREAAMRLRDEIDGELLLSARGEPSAPMQRLDTPHFKISYDHSFAGRAYGDRVVRILEEVRVGLKEALGRSLPNPLAVRLYTRGRYLAEYKHRFGFATVGFYDGTIHVVSARHPRRELFALLAHEHAHALFEDALKSHQPFFINEGIADRLEERYRGRPKVSRSEWRELVDALRGDSWIALESLVRGFNGVKGKRALLAYLESRAVIEMLDERDSGIIPRWLDRCAEGEPWRDALRTETGWTVLELESALQNHVRSRFPPEPLDAFKWSEKDSG